MLDRPNIVFFHVDNLGMGELGCYGGGAPRGADTRRADRFASEGLRLSRHGVEPRRTPTRSAPMAGRPTRSGNRAIAPGNNAGGLVAWEWTMGEILSGAGYATACHGKWHAEAEDGRWPTDHGFDGWYGPARAYDECLRPEDPHYVPERDGYSFMYEVRKGEGTREPRDQQLTQDLETNVDAEYRRRAFDSMDRSAAADKPFFLYFNHSLMHFPMNPRDEFKETSDRESCLVWLNDELHAMKWGQFKINFKRQQHFHDPELPLGFVRITHLMEDPKERGPANQRYVRWWVMQHAHNAVREFNESVEEEQLIPTRSPLDFVPGTGGRS